MRMSLPIAVLVVSCTRAPVPCRAPGASGLRADGSKEGEITYRRGNQHGPTNGWFASGESAWEGTYDENRRVGRWKVWSADRPARRRRSRPVVPPGAVTGGFGAC